MNTPIKKKILVVDDEPDVRESISLILRNKMSEANRYEITACSNAREALEKISENNIEVVLSDINMPEISGIELLEKVRKGKGNRQLPVILMTGFADLDIAVGAIKQGVFDFIIKPVHPEHLLHAINKAVQHNNYIKLKEHYKLFLEQSLAKRTSEVETAQSELESLSRELLARMTTVAEFRDTEAGDHISRIGIYCELIARTLKLPADIVRNIRLASPLHDIGKIGICDDILLKPGPLTSGEFEQMKFHTIEGQKILAGSSHSVIQMAESIALNHHERWDGSGYPNGLKGEDVPMEARIVMIVDQYDALRSKRPYKSSLGHEEVVKIITEGDGRTLPEHFAPDILNVFSKKASSMDEIYNSYKGTSF